MTEKQLLALYFDSPLQSWGYQSRFDRRTTLSYPTRSGVIGLICASMGADRSDQEILAKLQGLTLSVYCLRPGSRLDDFHTVGGGYDRKADRQRIVQTADGKVGGTVVTRRHYLQESCFCALIEGPADVLLLISNGLQDPKWGVWLGRKACIPASPVFQGLFSTETEAIAHVESLSPKNKAYRVIREAQLFDDGTDTLMDWPIDFL